MSGLKVWMTDNCPFAQRTWIALLEKEDDPAHPKNYLHTNVNYWNVDLEETKKFLAVYTTVPAGITGDGTQLKESLPMCYWVDENMGSKSPLQPPTAEGKERMKAAVAKFTSGEFDVCGAIWGVLMGEGAALENAKNKLFNAYKELGRDVKASGGPFLLGQQFTIADIAAYPFVERAKILLPHFKHLDLPSGEEFAGFQEWLAAVEARPSVKVTSADRTADSIAVQPFKAVKRSEYLIEATGPMLLGLKEIVRLQLRHAKPGQGVDVQAAIAEKKRLLAASTQEAAAVAAGKA